MARVMRVEQFAKRAKQYERTFIVSLLYGRFAPRPVREVNTLKARVWNIAG